MNLDIPDVHDLASVSLHVTRFCEYFTEMRANFTHALAPRDPCFGEMMRKVGEHAGQHYSTSVPPSLEICVVTPTYSRGDAYKEYLYEMFNVQDYPLKKLLIFRNGFDGDDNTIARKFWKTKEVQDARVSFSEIVTKKASQESDISNSTDTYYATGPLSLEEFGSGGPDVWTLGRQRNELNKIALGCMRGMSCQTGEAKSLHWYKSGDETKNGCDVITLMDDDDFYDAHYLGEVAQAFAEERTLFSQVKTFQEYFSQVDTVANKQIENTIFFYERGSLTGDRQPYRGFGWCCSFRRTVFDMGLAFGNTSRYEDLFLNAELEPLLRSPGTWKMLDPTVAVHFEVGQGTIARLGAAVLELDPRARPELDPSPAARQKAAAGKTLHHTPTKVRARVQDVYKTGSIAFQKVFCRLYGYADVRETLCAKSEDPSYQTRL